MVSARPAGSIEGEEWERGEGGEIAAEMLLEICYILLCGDHAALPKFTTICQE